VAKIRIAGGQFLDVVVKALHGESSAAVAKINGADALWFKQEISIAVIGRFDPDQRLR
jgi:hypothetical protein